MSSNPTYYADPLGGEPVDLPIEDGSPSRVYSVLGVDIYFHPSSGSFTAAMHPVEGKGSTSELRSTDFAHIVGRIRQRALVTPVEASLIVCDEQAADDADLVLVIPCTVVEHHAKRGEPWVVRVPEAIARVATASARRLPWVVHRIRTASEVYLPTDEQLDALHAATMALRDEHVRHRAEVDRLGAAQRAALNRVRKLDADDLLHVQATGQQPEPVAPAPAAPELPVFDLEPEEDA